MQIDRQTERRINERFGQTDKQTERQRDIDSRQREAEQDREIER